MNFPIIPSASAPTMPHDPKRLRTVAQALEASFLAEMLRHTGLGDARTTLGGGAGEAAFTGFLADAYAADLVRRGGVGLGEHLVRAIARAQDGRG